MSAGRGEEDSAEADDGASGSASSGFPRVAEAGRRLGEEHGGGGAGNDDEGRRLGGGQGAGPDQQPVGPGGRHLVKRGRSNLTGQI